MLIFNQSFLFEKFSDIPRKGRIRIFFRNARNKKKRTRLSGIALHTERLSEQPLDTVSFSAFSVFFSHANRHCGHLCRGIYDCERLRVRTLSRFQNSGNFFFPLDPQILHLALCGNVLSAFISSSLQRFAPTLRLHSLTEAVYFASLSLLGLISSFHNIILLRVVFFLIIKFFGLSVKRLSRVSYGQYEIKTLFLLKILHDKRGDCAVKGHHDFIFVKRSECVQ